MVVERLRCIRVIVYVEERKLVFTLGNVVEPSPDEIEGLTGAVSITQREKG